MKANESKIVFVLALAALLIGFVGWGLPTPSVALGPLGSLLNAGVKCTSPSPNTGDCITVWNGATLSFYSDAGATRKFYVDGSGNVTAAGTLTVTDLVSQTTGYALGNGTVGAPSLTFSSDTDTGLYRIGANNIGIATNGARIFDCSATGCTSAGTTTLTGVTTVSGAQTNSAAVTVNNNATITGTVKNAAGHDAIFYKQIDVAVADLTGTIAIAPPSAANAIKMVDAKAIAVGGACATVTTVDILGGTGGTQKLFTYAQANLTQSTVLYPGATGVTVLADGASYAASPANTNITINKTGSTPTTCTSIRFLLAYVIN